RRDVAQRPLGDGVLQHSAEPSCRIGGSGGILERYQVPGAGCQKFGIALRAFDLEKRRSGITALSTPSKQKRAGRKPDAFSVSSGTRHPAPGTRFTILFDCRRTE